MFSWGCLHVHNNEVKESNLWCDNCMGFKDCNAHYINRVKAVIKPNTVQYHCKKDFD